MTNDCPPVPWEDQLDWYCPACDEQVNTASGKWLWDGNFWRHYCAGYQSHMAVPKLEPVGHFRNSGIF